MARRMVLVQEQNSYNVHYHRYGANSRASLQMQSYFHFFALEDRKRKPVLRGCYKMAARSSGLFKQLSLIQLSMLRPSGCAARQGIATTEHINAARLPTTGNKPQKSLAILPANDRVKLAGSSTLIPLLGQRHPTPDRRTANL